MTDIVEVFWSARPHLQRLDIKIGGGPLDPRAATLFQEVRASIADEFPGCATLVRIATRKDLDVDLRVVRGGVSVIGDDVAVLRTRIDTAVAHVSEPAA